MSTFGDRLIADARAANAAMMRRASGQGVAHGPRDGGAEERAKSLRHRLTGMVVEAARLEAQRDELVLLLRQVEAHRGPRREALDLWKRVSDALLKYRRVEPW